MNACGTVVELRPHEGLGWVELDDGTRVLFGGTACKGFVVEVGTRVRVVGTKQSASGKVKAKRIELLDPPEAPSLAAQPAPPEIAWDAFVAAHARWSDASDCVLTPALDAPEVVLDPHPWFEPWHEEIVRSFAVMQNIDVPNYRAPKAFTPSPHDSFALGRTAFLEREDWPACATCGVPLEMCLQLAPEVIAPWLPHAEGRGLVAMYCFRCMPRHGFVDEVGSVFIELVAPRHVVELHDAPQSKSAAGPHSNQSQRLGFDVARNAPTTMWYRYRLERASNASSSLFGFDAVAIAGLEDMGEFVDVYESWIPANLGYDHLGGLPQWDQGDATPSCGRHGEMLQLLEFSGQNQFLDGALHVFVCRDTNCRRLAFVAEF